MIGSPKCERWSAALRYLLRLMEKTELVCIAVAQRESQGHYTKKNLDTDSPWSIRIQWLSSFFHSPSRPKPWKLKISARSSSACFLSFLADFREFSASRKFWRAREDSARQKIVQRIQLKHCTNLGCSLLDKVSSPRTMPNLVNQETNAPFISSYCGINESGR